ncbi:MAG TPA: acyl carrier protein [Pyrinomonadaceae bacterium]|jgi:acyl carrier protein
MADVLKVVAAIAIVVAAFKAFADWVERKHREKIESVFGGRQALDERAFYEKYFQASGVPAYVVTGIRRILERALAEDLSRLSDEDDFTGNLKFFFEEDDWAAIEVLEEIEKEFAVSFSREDGLRMRKVKDIVNLTWERIRQQHESR